MLSLSELFSWRNLNLMRYVVGIMIVIDGYPLIFFFKETLRLAPGSTAFTAAFLALGFIMMIPFHFLYKLYRLNTTLLKQALLFFAVIIFHMAFFRDQWFKDATMDTIYYIYVVLFLFLLVNIPNEIIKVFIPITVAFTVVSNLALVYALLTDPTWSIGQRAAIQFGEGEYRTGNPHVFARNALMSVVACAIWAFQPSTGFFGRILSFFACVFGMGILVMTQTRSSIVALILIIGLFFVFNVRPRQIKQVIRGLFRPASLVLIGVAFVGLSVFMQRNADLIAILYGYAVAFIERNMENVYALLGIKVQNQFTATFDASAGNRATSFQYLSNILEGHLHVVITGQGYKSTYLDVPLMEALINHGILGFVTFAAFCFSCLFYSLKTMRDNTDTLSIFLAYFFIMLFVQLFTNGRPYEISFWHPFCLMIRFIGISHLYAPDLRSQPMVSPAV
ncbi:O-antigen ligase family protein [Larkinella sp. VNQ87]|uniref:O-antigen ligase family protein n=1 Tax=Larkinella sp. VNQ87 TaxID=3400921 RepID=UPI003BFFE4C5